MIVFADTSALGSVYLGDEADAGWMGEVIFEGPDPVVVSQLAEVELASLLARACADGRLDDEGVSRRLDEFSRDSSDGGPIGVMPVTTDVVVDARDLVLRWRVRTLDALHLATAQLLADSSDEDVVLLSGDRCQRAAAEEVGLALLTRPPGDRPVLGDGLGVPRAARMLG